MATILEKCYIIVRFMAAFTIYLSFYLIILFIIRFGKNRKTLFTKKKIIKDEGKFSANKILLISSFIAQKLQL